MAKRPDPHAVALGRKGGRIGGKAKTRAKQLAARKNGRKGGRPPVAKKVVSALKSARRGGSKALDALVLGMTTDPQGTIAAIASSSDFDHLGDARNDCIAQAFGFKSFHDIARQMKQAFRR